MNELVSKGIITEISGGNNFEYVVAGQTAFMDTDYKVLQSQSSDIFVKCMKILRNGQTSICYLCNDYRTLGGMLQGLSGDNAVSIAAALVAAITKVKSNGFLSCQSIMLDPDKIFVDVNTNSVRLVYLPISERCHSTMDDFEAALQLLLSQLAPNVDSKTIASISQDECITLEALNAPFPFEISISEDDVLIGKKAELVDKVIEFNNAISRRHCRVIKLNGSFYIIDEGSANGTFVNNMRVEPQNKAQIKPGDFIRLANSEFRVK